VRKFGGLDVVCNNAGIGDEVNYKKTVAVNLVRSSCLYIMYLHVQIHMYIRIRRA
jgi:NAD(P)-dependent dehydrogenase (short-subunit alcohol dehydrogenase family)